jgi:steroid 5-alpha reductase family enzyme
MSKIKIGHAGGKIMKWYLYIIFSVAAFLLTIGIAYVVGSQLVISAVLLAFLISWIAYVPAYFFQTEKFYDLTGSIKYLFLTWFVYIFSYQEYGFNIGNLILASLISVWTLRLGSFLFMRIHKDGEDKRFRTIKTSASQFFLTWTLSGMWVSLCSICAFTAISNSSGVIMNSITYVGIGLFIIGFSIEVIADHQKTVFRSISENKDRFITSGLWSKSRHPNYLGEIILWFAIAVISVSSLNGSQYISLISPIFTYLLLVYVSGVRMLEDRSNKKWADNLEYQEYKKTTPILFFKI